MLMLLRLRIVAFFQKAIFAWFIRCATSVLYCPVCSTVAPRYFILLDLCKPLSFYIYLTLFLRCFLYDHVLVFLAFIAIPYCSQVASSLSIIMLKLLLTLCQYDCVICIYDVCDNLSIDVYSPSISQYFSYQVFRVNVEQTH